MIGLLQSYRSPAKKTRPNNRGFALLAVVILLALMTAAVALTLDEAVASLQDAGHVRTAEMIRASMDLGLGQAIAQVQQEDVVRIVDPTLTWDLFDRPSPVGSQEYLGPFAYPTSGPYQGHYRVRIGLRPGQRTRAPVGEDVKSSYGQIVEIQIGVEAVGIGMPSAEQRVSVGLLIPRKRSGAN